MFHIVLFQPEIPPNTGNIIRLAANTNCSLHLIKPLGFTIDDKKLRRAGLDYHDWATVNLYESYAEFLKKISPPRIFAYSTKGISFYTDIQYKKQDAFLFGAETRGLSAEILQTFQSSKLLKIPLTDHSRSLNLSNSVAIVVYEALRQHHFDFK